MVWCWFQSKIKDIALFRTIEAVVNSIVYTEYVQIVDGTWRGILILVKLLSGG